MLSIPTICSLILELNICFLVLKNISTILSAPFEFVRMDFYIDIEDKIYLSEYTFTPAAGFQYYSCKVEKELGKIWI